MPRPLLSWLVAPPQIPRPKAAQNPEEVMPHASKPTRPRAVKRAPAPVTAVPVQKDLAGAREEEDDREHEDALTPPLESVSQDVGEPPPAAALLGEPMRFRVVDRAGRTLSEFVGCEDATAFNTAVQGHLVIRIEDGKPMTETRGRARTSVDLATQWLDGVRAATAVRGRRRRTAVTE